MKSRRALERRTMLRGMAGAVGVALALPVLEAMLGDHGDALADGTVLPVRFGVFFWSDGVHPERWIPSGEGAGWQPSLGLQPLADAGLSGDLTVVSGMKIGVGEGQHVSGQAGILTGAPFHRDTPGDTAAVPTIDQVVARHPLFDGRTKYRSLELGVCDVHTPTPVTLQAYLSHNGPYSVNPADCDPQSVFDRLFGGGPVDERDVDARLSVMDAVRGQAKSLQKRLGAKDVARLDEYLESVRAIELMLEKSAVCATPAPPGALPPSALVERSAAMAELLAVALSCDLTRVFTMQFSNHASSPFLAQLNPSVDLHGISHDPNGQEQLHQGIVFSMQQLAVLLARLRSVKEGDGTLLDRCGILATSEFWTGVDHGFLEHPILVAGRAGGALKAGLHHRAPGENASKVLLTLLRAVGLPLAELGAEGGHVTEGLTAIEA